MSKRRLLVYSIDAMVFEDLSLIRTLPHLGPMFEGSRVEKMQTVYPSVTYPAHTSMQTGCYPDKHGIVNNERLMVGAVKPDWEWDAGRIRVDTLLDIAHRAGFSTCAINWPVTGRTKSIDYVVNEIWTREPGEDPLEPHRWSGASPETMEIIGRHAHVLNSNRHPEIDEFGIRCACDLIRKYQPEVMLVHQAYVDNRRHCYGLFNEYVNEGLERSDRWFGDLLDALHEAGVLEQTDLVVTSDHGQMNIQRVCHPLVHLADKGFIRLNDDGSIRDWDVAIQPCGLSAQLVMRPDASPELREQVYRELCWMRDEEIYGFSEVFTEQEARQRHHLGGDFDFVLETDGFSSFGKNVVRPQVTSFDLSDYKYGRATHGYLPEKGPQPPFLVKGPHFTRGAVIHAGKIVDEAPTYAALLGLSLPEADGTAIRELLKTEE